MVPVFLRALITPMFDSYLLALAMVMSFAVLAWGVSLRLRDVSIVDSIWSLMIAATSRAYFALTPQVEPRVYIVLFRV